MRSAVDGRLGQAVVVGAVFFTSAIGLVVLHAETAPHYRLSTSRAVAAARADPAVQRFLSRHPTTRAESIPLDRRLRRVTFFDGPRVVLDAAVDPDGTVRFRQEHVPGRAESGSPVATSPWMLAVLTMVFVLATAVVPLRRLRNLDVLVLASFVVPIGLLNQQLVAASVLASAPALAYLAIRCLLRTTGQRASPKPSQPLLDRVTASWEEQRRLRLLGLVTSATAVAFLMITLTSTGESDVAAASLSGATQLLHGHLPYGHVSGYIVHGDTYPLLTYVTYIPGAAWAPVTDAFSDLSGALPVAAAAALLAAAAIYRAACAISPRRDALRLVLAWLAFPPMLLAASRVERPRPGCVPGRCAGSAGAAGCLDAHARRGRLGQGCATGARSSVVGAISSRVSVAGGDRSAHAVGGAGGLAPRTRRARRFAGDGELPVIPVSAGVLPCAVAALRAAMAAAGDAGRHPSRLGVAAVDLAP